MAETNDIIAEAIEFHKYAAEVWDDARKLAINDLEFCNIDNAQWDKEALDAREGRPCLTIDRLSSYIDQVVGDIRQNTPSIKIRPASDGADKETAEIIEGLIRSIEYKSNADSVYETAAEQAVASSIGAYRILTQYVDDDSFDQEIIIKRIKNQFTVTPDPDCTEPDFSDMMKCIVSETMTHAKFKVSFPNVDMSDFPEECDGEENEGWYMDGKVRVAEYFRRVKKEGKLYLLTDGTITDQTPPKRLIVKERDKTTYTVEWRKITGDKVLEGPITLDCSTIPIVMVMGKESNVSGKVFYRSLIRKAKTSAQIYNYMRSAHVEMVALSPKVPFIVTVDQIEGHEGQWQTANAKAYPYLVVNATNDGYPQRTAPITTHPGLVNEIAQAADEIKQTTSLFDPSRGQESGAASGRAILALQNKGDIATLVFKDNLARAIRYGGRVICDMIPKIYDTERILSIVKKDGEHENVTINQTDPITGGVMNSLSKGKYNIVVDTGPSYTTQRMEAAESQLQLIQAAPQLMGVIGDLVVKNFDWPGADGIAERIKRSLPAELTRDKDEEPKVDPMQELQQKMQSVMAELEIQRKQLENAKIEADAVLSLARAEAAEEGTQMETYRLQFDAMSQDMADMKVQYDMQMPQQAQQAQQGIEANPEQIQQMEEDL